MYPSESPACRFIHAVSGRVRPLDNVLNGVGEATGINALGQAADKIGNGEIVSGLFLLGMTIAENSPEGQGGRIAFSGKKVTNALADALGIGRRDLGDRIEKIKKASKLGGADNVKIDDFGNVISKKDDEIIGNVHDEFRGK